MPLHPWRFHHLALGNHKGRGERISGLQRAVHDIMGADWHMRMRSGVTNVVDVYTDVPTNHQLDLELNAMVVLWESRKQGQSVRRLQYSRSTSTWYCPWVKILSVRNTLRGCAGGTVFIVWVRLGRVPQFCSRFGNGGG